MLTMKKYIHLLLIISSAALLQCSSKKNSEEQNPIQAKDTVAPQPVVGADVDAHGCKPSAGYKWSVLKNNCIRIFEDGISLKPLQDSMDQTTVVYVLFSDDASRAELFLPTQKESILLNRKAEGQPWIKDEWMLLSWKGYVLKRNDVALYGGG